MPSAVLWIFRSVADNAERGTAGSMQPFIEDHNESFTQKRSERLPILLHTSFIRSAKAVERKPGEEGSVSAARARSLTGRALALKCSPQEVWKQNQAHLRRAVSAPSKAGAQPVCPPPQPAANCSPGELCHS